MAEHRNAAAANVAAVLLGMVAFAAWGVATTRIDPVGYDHLGLVAAVGPLFWVALGCGLVAFGCAVRARHFRWYVALFALAAVIAVLYTTPSLVEGVARVEASYGHLGLAHRMALTGQLGDTTTGLGRPGFFATLATLQQAAGDGDLQAMVRWAPTVLAFGFLPPVLLLVRSLTPEARIQWLTAGGIVLVGRTGQDHLAPQALALWLLVCVAAVVMTTIRRGDEAVSPWPGRRGTRVRLSRAQSTAVQGLVLLGVIAVVASHLWVSGALVLVLLGIWLAGRGPSWWLWAGAAVATTCWLTVPTWVTHVR